MSSQGRKVDVLVSRPLKRAFRQPLQDHASHVEDRRPAEIADHVRQVAAGVERPALPVLVVLEADQAQELLAEFDDHFPPEIALLAVTDRTEFPEWSTRGAVADVISRRARPAARALAVQRGLTHAERRAELHRVHRMSQLQGRYVQELNSIGLALSTEHNLDQLLELIVTKVRDLTQADAGSLYLVERDETGETEGMLFFKVAQNDTLNLDFSAFRMPINRQSVAGYVALTDNILNLPDVYEIPEAAEYNFNRSFDQQTNYRSKSMLVVPMINHAGTVIGVLQLINKKREFEQLLTGKDVVERQVRPFSAEDEELVSSVASQAAVAIENAQLYEAIRHQFESFIHASVWAIEQRDPATAGHSERVTRMTMALARAVDAADGRRFDRVNYDAEDLREIYYAGMLHDFGKINVREHVFTKAKKLYPHQLKAVEDRFQVIRKSLASQAAERVVQALSEGDRDSGLATKERLEADLRRELDQLDAYWQVVLQANEPAVLQSEAREELDEMRAKRYTDPELGEIPLLTDEEYANLSIPRGSLNDEERAEIQSHVSHSHNFLQQIPWTQDLDNVADIAWAHHETLNGTGYPRGIAGDEIRLESRMMTICDIFDALTASDRPYKRAMPLEKALSILRMEADEGKLDKDLLDLFIAAEVYKEVPAGQAGEDDRA